MAATIEKLTEQLQYCNLPVGAIIPWRRAVGQDVPLGWELCDGTGHDAPNLSNLFLRGAGNTPQGGIMGSDKAHISIAGSDSAVPQGNGWSRENPQFIANYDVATVPRHYAVVFIMKISNFD